MADFNDVKDRLYKRRSRALWREGRNQRSLRLQSEKNTTVKAVLTRHAPGLSFFKKGDRNLILRAGGQHIGDFFISDYLPLRFNRGYARTVLFYRPSAKYEEWKAVILGHGVRDLAGAFVGNVNANEPLVLTGALRESALNRSYAVSRAAAGRFSVVVRIPTPATSEGFRYSNNKEVRKVLRSLPMKEVKALANRLGRFIQHSIGQGTLRTRMYNRPKAAQGPLMKGGAWRAPTMSIRMSRTQRSSLRESIGSRPSLRSRAPVRQTLATQAAYSGE